MAAACRAGVLPIPCSAWELWRIEHGARGAEPILAESSPASRSETSHQLGTLRPHRQKLDTNAQSHASLSKRALLRQTPEVGARCGNSARRDLCGGPLERAVPTAPDTFHMREPCLPPTSSLPHFPKITTNKIYIDMTILIHYSKLIKTINQQITDRFYKLIHCLYNPD